MHLVEQQRRKKVCEWRKQLKKMDENGRNCIKEAQKHKSSRL